MNRRKPLTILNYAVNGLGMGHITRLIAINTNIRRLCAIVNKPLVSLFLTTSEADTLAHRHSFPAYKIPSMTLAEEGKIPQKLYKTLSRHWVWNAFALWQPDISVIDTFPAGSFGELPAVLQDSPKNVFVHRAIREEQESKQSFIDAMKLYDTVIRVQEPYHQVKHTAESEGENNVNVPPIILEKRETNKTPHQATKHILVLAGGGGDSNSGLFWEMMLDISKKIPHRHFIFAIGALHRGSTPHRNNVIWVNTELNLHHYTECEFAISAGGFNSVYELLYYGVPTLFYEQTRKFDDQYQRIIHLEKMGLCRAVNLESIDSLMKAILNMDEDHCQQIRSTLSKLTWHNGCQKAAEAIVSGYVKSDVLDDASSSIQALASFWQTLSLEEEQLFLDTLYTCASLMKSAGLDRTIEEKVNSALVFWNNFAQQPTTVTEKRFILKELIKQPKNKPSFIDNYSRDFLRILQNI